VNTIDPGTALRILFPTHPIGVVSVDPDPDHSHLYNLWRWACVNVPHGTDPETWRASQHGQMYKYPRCVAAREAVFWMMRHRWAERRLTAQPSYPEIANVVGMSHTSVLEAVRRVNARLAKALYPYAVQ
jgi:hypothetical protein